MSYSLPAWHRFKVAAAEVCFKNKDFLNWIQNQLKSHCKHNFSGTNHEMITFTINYKTEEAYIINTIFCTDRPIPFNHIQPTCQEKCLWKVENAFSTGGQHVFHRILSRYL